MSDKEAFAIAEADNAGRSGITAMQRRGSGHILERIYGRNRQEFFAATGRSGLIVSRTLGLLSLPDYVRG